MTASGASAAGSLCVATAGAAYLACQNEVRDDFWIARGNCNNLGAAFERRDCRLEARQELAEARMLCREQRAARNDLCAELNVPDGSGHGPYDPDFGPYVDPLQIGGGVAPNPYFPLQVGNKWVYEDGEGEETITVEVMNATKAIEDATCIVVNDTVEQDFEDPPFDVMPLSDVATEVTDDWYAQNLTGDVIYCGEISEEREPQPGDMPILPAELVAIDGSWKWGRDGGKPGIVMQALPSQGAVYRQEFALGEAEDAAAVVRAAYVFGMGDDLDELVPEDVEDLMDLCGAGCVVTRDFTPIEPDVSELKFYAPGTGLILELNPEEDEFVALVGCNVPGSACPPL